VYDYVAGKKDWFASGLPREGTAAAEPSAGEVARKDVPTCGLQDRVGDVQERLAETSWDTCIVANDERVVLGRLGREALAGDANATAEEVMQPGPVTWRPNADAAELADWMREKKVASTVITTSDGRLVGLLRREDAGRLQG
jgi:predicted transcriptional regulator